MGASAIGRRIGTVTAAAVVALVVGAAPAVAADQTRLKLRGSPYGTVLFANGYAMYVFTADQGSASRCYGSCAKAWPPLIAEGEIVTGKGVKRSKLATTTREDGSEQLTYAGRPLYGYSDDPRGEVYCQDVEEYGGTWYAVRPSGRPASSS